MIDLDTLRRTGRIDDDLDGDGEESTADHETHAMGLPFDPAVVGPLDLVSMIIRWVEERLLWIIGITVVGSLGYAWLAVSYGISISIPTWVWVGTLSMIGGGLVTAYPVRKLIDWMSSDDSYVLVDQSPVDGELGVYELSADRWSDLTVYDRNGTSRSTTYLHEVRLRSGGRGWEVDGYDPDQNVAVSSWMAGASNRDIRRHEKMVDLVKRELSAEAELAVDELIDAPEAIRSVGSEVAHEIIMTAEQIESPGRGSVSDRLSEIVQREEEKVSDVLDDNTVDLSDADGESIEIDDIVSTSGSGSDTEATA